MMNCFQGLQRIYTLRRYGMAEVLRRIHWYACPGGLRFTPTPSPPLSDPPTGDVAGGHRYQALDGGRLFFSSSSSYTSSSFSSSSSSSSSSTAHL